MNLEQICCRGFIVFCVFMAGFSVGGCVQSAESRGSRNGFYELRQKCLDSGCGKWETNGKGVNEFKFVSPRKGSLVVPPC